MSRIHPGMVVILKKVRVTTIHQHSNELKHGGTSANEYVQAEKNSNVKRSIAEQEQQKVEQLEYSSSKKRDVKVTLIFPTASDSKVESEFISRLKEIYLKKIEAGAMQEREGALQSQSTDKSVVLSNAKEENPLFLQGQSHFASQNEED